MKATNRICVIGGGAAGMMAAGTAYLYGADVTIFESMPFLGKKLAITGKGRCNVTNTSGIQELLDNITKNPRFLYSALCTYTPDDVMSMFENLGVSLKVERGNRVYPKSDKAKDIVDAMRKYCEGAHIINEKVKKIRSNESGTFTVKTDKEYTFDRVIIATGGKSYPLTGSDGSGYRLATALGHSVTELIPSLIPINSPSKLCPDMQGLSLKNVGIKIFGPNGDVLYTDFGEMMFTHFGVTGLLISGPRSPRTLFMSHSAHESHSIRGSPDSHFSASHSTVTVLACMIPSYSLRNSTVSPFTTLSLMEYSGLDDVNPKNLSSTVS